VRDLHVNITGPRDRAKQNVTFHVAQSDQRRSLDVRQIGKLIAELRTGLAESNLPADDRRRAERHLATIEEETTSEKPLLSEINDSVSFLGQMMQTAQGLAPIVSSSLQLLKTAIAGP